MDEATDLRATLDAIVACESRLTPAGADDIRAGAAKLLARAERMVGSGGEIKLTPWQKFSRRKAREGLSFAQIARAWKKAPDNPKTSV